MTTVIRNHNDPNHAITLNNEWVNRQDEIYLPSYHKSFPCLQTSMHFVFRDPAEHKRMMSSTLFCTCGSPAAIFDYLAYRKWKSKNEGEMIACIEFIQQGVHADGSHE